MNAAVQQQQLQQLTAQAAHLKCTNSQQVEIAVVHQQVLEQPRAAHMAVSLTGFNEALFVLLQD